ncbi:MAG: hypothetical protein WCL61_00970 [bacterium]
MRDIFPQQPNPNHDRFSEDNLKAVAFCPVCHNRYNPMEAKIIDETDSSHLLHVKCHNCHSAILALISVSGVGISSFGLVTDLDVQEIRRFSQLNAIKSA